MLIGFSGWEYGSSYLVGRVSASVTRRRAWEWRITRSLSSGARSRDPLANPPCDRRSRKPLEKRPDRLRAVDVVVLRAEDEIDQPNEPAVRKAAGHAVPAVIDAI